MTRIKVLFFYPNEFLGSELAVFTNVIRNLDHTRFAPYLVLNSEAEGVLKANMPDGVTIRRFRFGRRLVGPPRDVVRWAIQSVFSLAGLIRYARNDGIDIVHCAESPRPSMLALILARLIGAPLLMHFHSVPHNHTGIRRALRNAVTRWSDYAVVVSQFVAMKIQETGVHPDKVAVIVNGVDPNQFHPDIDGSAIRREYGIEPNEILVLEMARIVFHKRQADLVRAFAIARRQVPELRCLIMGWVEPNYHGPFNSYLDELQHICEEEGLGDNLIIAPGRPEAPHILAAADIVVLPSVDDPCPLVVIEAMASGKPVIGASSGGIPEEVVDGATGFLVPPGSPEAIAEKLVLLAKKRDTRVQMGDAGRRRVETYLNEERVAAEFAPIYEMLVHRHLPRSSKRPAPTVICNGHPD